MPDTTGSNNSPPVATPVTSADVAIAQGLNQALTTISGALSGDTTAVVAILNAIASAITSSIIGGTTGTTDSLILRSKGTSGFALQNSGATLDNSANISGLATITQNAGGNNFATDRAIIASTHSGQTRYKADETNGLLRWLYGTDPSTESGSNAGSNFIIQRYADNGVLLDQPIVITRSSGLVTTNSLATTTLTVNGVSIPQAAISPAAQLLTASQTVTIPANATKLKVTLLGGGGGGAGCSNAAGCPTPITAVGGPGGGAAALIKYLSGLTSGNTLILTIGAAGAAGGSNANGGNGGDTTLASGTQTITTLTAGKGSGGTNLGVAGAPGTATNGDLNMTAGTGLASPALNLSMPEPPPIFGGVKATTTTGASSTVNGSAGTGFGAPGSGGVNSNTAVSTTTGGAGTAGCAIFEWYA